MPSYPHRWFRARPTLLAPICIAAVALVLQAPELPGSALAAAETTLGTRWLGKAGASEPILPLPERLDLQSDKVALGNRLFHDKRLSGNDSLSCAGCHDLRKGGDDGRRHAVGWKGKTVAINTPTVFNSAFNFVQYWDGRAKSLEDQIDGPIHHPDEMGSSWDEVLKKLGQDRHMLRDFRMLYRDGLTAANIKDAIATFERSLVTPNARFDRYLRGEADAITADEKAGYALFKSLGCSACHQGKNVGGNLFQRLGVVKDYFRGRTPSKADLGRYNVTLDDRDRHVFKVPSLRNIELTTPYFHDGSAETLQQAVEVMAWYQLGRSLAGEDVARIVAFLETLTGAYQGAQR